MLKILIRWIVSALALYITIKIGQNLNIERFYLEKGLTGVTGLLVAAVLLALANTFLKPIAKLLTLPLSCMTFGLFTFVINAFLFWLVGQFVPGYHIAGWQAPLFGSIVMGIVSGLLNAVLDRTLERKKDARKNN